MKNQEIKILFRALFYARVSSVKDTQDSSIENQIALGESFLTKHPEIVLAEPIETYVEKVSGKSDCRERYIALMARLSKGDIDYLIVKDLKRLNRSTEVSAQLKNLCKKYNFKLILLETGRIYDPNAEENRMLYGFEALVNEEVVHRQSTYGKIAHAQKMEAKRLNRQNETFGFRWNDQIKDMVIHAEEAEVIRRLYEKVIFEDMGVMELRSWLKSIGIKVCVNTIRRWLHETAYVGLFAMNKKGSELGVGAGQKTRHFFNPKDQWVYVEREDLRILEQEIFDLVQRIMESRKVTYNNKTYEHSRFHGTHLFSGKVFCKECQNSYVHCWSDQKKTISVYKDSHGKKHEPFSCINNDYKKIYEADLEKITLFAINGFLSERQACFELLLKTIEKTLTDGCSKNKEQEQLERKILKAEKDAEKILESYLEANGALKLALAEKYETIIQNIEDLKTHRVADSDKEEKRDILAQRICDIQKRLGEMKQLETLDRETVLQFVKRIEINKEGEIEVFLNVESMYKTKLDAWQNRKQSSDKKTAFLVSVQSVFYIYDEEFYRDIVSEITQGMMVL